MVGAGRGTEGTGGCVTGQYEPYKVGSLVRDNRGGEWLASEKGIGVVVAFRMNEYQVYWGDYGTFWSPHKDLELVSAGR